MADRPYRSPRGCVAHHRCSIARRSSQRLVDRYLLRIWFSLSPTSRTFLLYRRTQARRLFALQWYLFGRDADSVGLSVNQIITVRRSSGAEMVVCRRDPAVRRFLFDVCRSLGEHAHDALRHWIHIRLSSGVLCNAGTC